MAERTSVAKKPATQPAAARDNVDGQSRWIALIVLITTILAVFGRVVRQQFVVWDDQIHVYGNKYIIEFTSDDIHYLWTHFYENLYIPLSYTLYGLIAIKARLPQPDMSMGSPQVLDPHPFHTANLVLHTINAVLAFAILRLVAGWWTAGVSGSRWKRNGPALIGALLFALHPLQVESVCWISELRGLLCSVFSLAAIYSYLLAVTNRDGTPVDGVPLTKPAYWLAFLLTVLALLSKPTAVAMPFALFALDRWIVGRPTRIAALSASAWIAIAIPFVIATRTGQPVPAEDITPFWTRPFIAGDSLAFYISKLFVPWPLGIDYGRKPTLIVQSGICFWSWILPAVAAALIYRLRRKAPSVVGACLFSVAFVLPVVGLIPFVFQDYSTVADRYMYLSMLGPALIVTWALTTCTAGTSRQAIRTGAYAGFGAVLAGLAVLSAIQVSHWDNSITLMSNATRVNPNGFQVYTNYGIALANAGRNKDAIVEYLMATKLRPTSPFAYNNMGLSYQDIGDLPDAIAAFNEAIENSKPDDPLLGSTRIALGKALLDTGNASEAAEQLEMGLQINPHYAADHTTYANALLMLNRLDEAVSEYNAALAITPTYAPALYGLGTVQLQRGQISDAEANCQQAVDVSPKDSQAHVSLAMVWMQLKRYDDCISEYRQALAIKPSDSLAHFNLGVAYYYKGDRTDALPELQQAVKLDPSEVHHLALGMLYDAMGDFTDAKAEDTAALQVNPNSQAARYNSRSWRERCIHGDHNADLRT